LKYNKFSGLQIEGFSSRAAKYLMNYNWPGNVRELENVIERIMVLADKPALEEQDIPEYIKVNSAENIFDISADEYSIKKMERLIEEKLIRKALAKTHGNKSRAVKLLEISYPALLSKIEEYGIEPE
jgi:two-component system response regulator AtoC